jgi:DegV family protein with EDD domain
LNAKEEIMSERRIAIVTDSTCDIPPQLVEELGIIVVPQHLIWGMTELRDGVDIDRPTFYARLRTDPAHPRSACPRSAVFVRAIRELGEGATKAVVVTISSQLSDTAKSAYGARDQLLLDIPLHVVDSLSCSMGLGWQVLAAARARDQGADVKTILAEIRRVREQMSLFLTIDTLDYLRKSGRIGGMSRFMWSTFQRKPLLVVDTATGRIEQRELVRTRERALHRLVEITFERVDPARPLHVAVLHGAALDEARAIHDEIEARYHPVELLFGQVTPILGIHTGPGVVSLCAYND